LAPTRVAPERLATTRYASLISALVRLAFRMFASQRYAVIRSVPLKSASDNSNRNLSLLHISCILPLSQIDDFWRY
jgi:hypothetical protein